MTGEPSARRGKRLAAAIVVVLAMWIDHCQSRVVNERCVLAPPRVVMVPSGNLPTPIGPPPRPGVVMCHLQKQ